MPSETEGKLTIGLTPTSKGPPKLDLSIERHTDLKLTLKRCSEETALTTLGQEDDIRNRQLAQDAGLTFMIIYNVFLIPWTYAYQSNAFYHGHDSILVQTQSNCLVVANYLCLVLMGLPWWISVL